MSVFDAFHATDPVWVFGYGSLIWRPDFPYLHAQPALLRGAHRCLCVYSHRYRGTPERPGLVFGLKPGGSCHGMAFEVDADHWSDVRAYLWDREMLNGVYRPAMRRVRLSDRRTVRALAFMVEPRHDQYAGALDFDEQVRIVVNGEGSLGPNIDYVLNTARHLEDLGIRDAGLQRISRHLMRHHSAKSGSDLTV